MDHAAMALMKHKGAAAAIAALTNFTLATGDALVDEWNTLFGELFVRFSDGFDTTALPRPPPTPGMSSHASYTPGGSALVEVKEQGYVSRKCLPNCCILYHFGLVMFFIAAANSGRLLVVYDCRGIPVTGRRLVCANCC